MKHSKFRGNWLKTETLQQPMVNGKYNKCEYNGKRIGQCKQSLPQCRIGLVKDHDGHL